MNNRRNFLAGSAGAMGLGALGAGTLGIALTTGPAVAQQATRSPAATPPQLVLPALPVPTLQVNGQEAEFPVRRIYCVGRNYLAHVEELNHDTREAPFFFQKARDMLVRTGGEVAYPSRTEDYEHEVELVLAMKSGGMNITPEEAMGHVYGYAVGLDMTRRDLQNRAQEKRQPWEAGKSFDQSAPCGPITPMGAAPMRDARIHLAVNGRTVTDGNIKDMIWNPAEIVAQLSTLFAIAAGDLIYTGTPAGVGKVGPGDTLLAQVDGLSDLEVRIVQG
ncbi:fumarylacetoacetate hydrolase family protein [Roseomonas elaeocarpi]|uniref:Fumarylacetoacetate hydrolase family protein n=1 Tax=Roseomonas elaeocarpi TaxID=907779 RepID=A0ABV6JW58_9PROT